MIDLSKTKVKNEAWVSDADFADPGIVALNDWAKGERDSTYAKGETQVQEQAAALREGNVAIAATTRLPNQEHHTNRAARVMNIMSTRKFMGKLNKILNRRHAEARLRDCDPGPSGQFANMKGLFVLMPGEERKVFDESWPVGWKFITATQDPNMSEWSLLGEDEHGAPSGIKLIGWRQVLLQLVMKDALSEREAHAEFGEPMSGIQSSIYRERLFGKRKIN